MALHPDFPDNPHAILDPALRWFPAPDGSDHWNRLGRHFLAHHQAEPFADHVQMLHHGTLQLYWVN